MARYLIVLNIFLIALHVIPETGGKAEIRGLLESVIYVFVHFTLLVRLLVRLNWSTL